MSDIEEITDKAQSVWESFKKVFSLLKERKWFAAFKECFSFLRLIYRNYLKGKYFTIKGKKIPRTLVAVATLLLVYTALPSNETKQPTGEQPIAEAANVKKEADIFDKDGLKVYDLRKCETEKSVGVCGKIENYGDYDFGKITVNITFHAPDGTVIYDGGVEAADVKSHTRIKMTAPCPDEFSYFKLKDVTLEDKKTAE
ncbi:MAG: hypothetical protein IJ532_03285 [Alphaproteobacteria bacterium]|nr:hypothetical protein [Alphaproteobacteria bacterium]